MASEVFRGFKRFSEGFGGFQRFFRGPLRAPLRVSSQSCGSGEGVTQSPQRAGLLFSNPQSRKMKIRGIRRGTSGEVRGNFCNVKMNYITGKII